MTYNPNLILSAINASVMDAPDGSLEERTRRVHAILAAVARDPALDESLRETTENAVERLDAALADGIEDPSVPDTFF